MYPLFYKFFKARWTNFVLFIFGISGLTILILFFILLSSSIRSISEQFASAHILKEKVNLKNHIEPDLELCKKIADSPLFKAWIKDENNPELKKQALQELQSYGRQFSGKLFFFAIDSSKNNYMGNGNSQESLNITSQTLSKDEPDDQWYFESIRKVDNYALNIDYNKVLNSTKVWINIILKDKEKKIGIAGTGIPLDSFVNKIVNDKQKGIENMLLDRKGAIQLYRKQEYIEQNALSKEISDMSAIFQFISSEKQQKLLKTKLDKLATGKEDSSILWLQWNGKKQLVAVTYLPKIDWFLVSLVYPSQIISTNPFVLISLLCIFAVLLLMGCIVILKVIIPVTRSDFETKISTMENLSTK